MRTVNFLYLVAGYLREKRYRYAATMFGIAVAIAVLCAVTALALGIKKSVIPHMEKLFPEKILIAKPRTTDLSVVRLDVTTITDEAIRRIERLPGVERISPQIGLAFPVSAEGSIFGETLRTDVVVHGVSEWLVEPDVAPGQTLRYSPNPDEPIPVLISQYFVDIYNMGLAQSSGLPKFNPQALIGREFRLFLGEYTMMAVGTPAKHRQVMCKIVGLSHALSLLGITMPLRYVQEFNEWYYGKPSAYYTALHVSLRSLADFDAVSSELQKLGLLVESHRDTLNRYRSALRLAVVVLTVLSLSIVVVAMNNLANVIGLIMIERRGDIGLLKALGATQREMLAAFLAEVCAIAGIGSLLGAGTSLVVMLAARSHIEKLLSRFSSVIPSGILYLHWALVPAVVLFALGLSILVALPVIKRTASRPATQLLSEE